MRGRVLNQGQSPRGVSLTCVRCHLPAELAVCDECSKRLTPYLRELVTDRADGIEERVIKFFTYLDQLQGFARKSA